jgi:hypothetical protein
VNLWCWAQCISLRVYRSPWSIPHSHLHEHRHCFRKGNLLTRLPACAEDLSERSKRTLQSAGTWYSPTEFTAGALYTTSAKYGAPMTRNADWLCLVHRLAFVCLRSLFGRWLQPKLRIRVQIRRPALPHPPYPYRIFNSHGPLLVVWFVTS